MTDDTKILYKDYTEEEPYEGDCCPPNYWTCEKGVGITLPEYALSRSLTYEGARRKILKYRDELIPHIRIRSGTQYLDDVAVDFLDRHGRKKAAETAAYCKQIKARQKTDGKGDGISADELSG